MPQPFFLELSALGIYRGNLLELGMEIYSYNDLSFGSFLPELLLAGFWHHQLYSDPGADIVMESISLIDHRSKREMDWFQQLVADRKRRG